MSKERDGVYGGYYYWLGNFRCCICGDMGGPPHHIRSVGAGGKDDANIIPICYKHHQEVHRGKQTFERKYGVVLKDLAESWYAYYRGTGDYPEQVDKGDKR